MEAQKIIVTVIDSAGIVEAKNDLAHFSLSLRSKSETLDNAKNQTEEKTGQFLKALDQLKAKGMKLDREMTISRDNYKLEHRENGEKTPAGFQVIHTVSFVVAVDEHLDEIFKTCLKFDAHMSRPYFSIKNREVLAEKATKKAAQNAKDKLNVECSLLGVSPEKLVIQNWSFGYEGYLPSANSSNYYGVAGVTGATGPQGSAGPGAYNWAPVPVKVGTTYQEPLDYKLEPGMVSVKVVLRVNYNWA